MRARALRCEFRALIRSHAGFGFKGLGFGGLGLVGFIGVWGLRVSGHAVHYFAQTGTLNPKTFVLEA